MAKRTMIERQDWQEFSQYHWRTTIDGQKLDYWPTSGKWMYCGRVHKGGLGKWLNDRKFSFPKPVKKLRAVSAEYIDGLRDDIEFAHDLYEKGKKQSVLHFMKHLQNKLRNCEIV